MNSILQRQKRRQHRIRRKLKENIVRPRLCVHRSNQWMEVQIIDDQRSHTVAGMNERALAEGREKPAVSVPEEFTRSLRSQRAFQLGWMVSQKARGAGVTAVRFDRSGYRYHGRVHALAEGARAGGLQF